MTPKPSADLATALVQSIKARKDRPFLMDETESLSGREFLGRVSARQEQVKAVKSEERTQVLVCCGQGLQHWIDAVAVWGLGGVVVPLNHSLSQEQVDVILEVSEPGVILGTHPRVTDLPTNVRQLDETLQKPADKADAITTIGQMEDLATIVFTSGSTGQPKGVALTHQSLLGNARATLGALNPKEGDRLFFPIPFNFISAISHFLVMTLAGAEIWATERRMMFADLYSALRNSGATCFGGSPMHLRWIAECADTDPINLDWAMSSGDHLSVNVIRNLRKTLPETRVFTAYGLTELGGRFCFLPPEMVDDHAGSVGTPIEGLIVQILDENLKPVPDGTIGEIFADGAYLMEGYFRSPDATAQAFPGPGLRTGDLGFRDASGLLHINGRVDDIFKCHGEKISAVTIAEALMETGEFTDIAVVGWDDPVFGTVPRVIYVPSRPDGFDKAVVMRTIRAKLPASHLPRMFTAVEAIPRTGSGKIKRKELRQMVEAI